MSSDTNTRTNGKNRKEKEILDRIQKLNDKIIEHLTLEEDCQCNIRTIVAEALED